MRREKTSVVQFVDKSLNLSLLRKIIFSFILNRGKISFEVVSKSVIYAEKKNI